MKPSLRKDPVWWHGCAFCPDDTQPQNGHHAGFNNTFRADDLTVVVLYGRRRPRLRRVHLRCLPLALTAGVAMPPLVAPPAVELELVEQLTQALWGWSGPLPANVVQHWDELLDDVEGGIYDPDSEL